ncbi:MAG: hypothetical protein CFH10_01195 [Alphaproteobacteria bacterium MarineAlpha4_Bin2]|nr:MAG: hypothetical protein CFH10_01195 [Alphaproteobacteria bacterium MarineAlpha4_Bin2]
MFLVIFGMLKSYEGRTDIDEQLNQIVEEFIDAKGGRELRKSLSNQMGRCLLRVKRGILYLALRKRKLRCCM